jgi:hypothetical protein
MVGNDLRTLTLAIRCKPSFEKQNASTTLGELVCKWDTRGTAIDDYVVPGGTQDG